MHLVGLYYAQLLGIWPIPVAARSRAWACGRLPAGIAGSNPAEGMVVSCECCGLPGRGLCVRLITRPEETYRVSTLGLTLVNVTVAQLVEALRYNPEGHWSDSWWCHWKSSLTQSFRLHYGPGVDSACIRNEYQEYFLGVKAAGAYGWLYLLHVPIVWKYGSLNLLEPSGPVQGCNGIALLCQCKLLKS